jgi:hypothetical protein
VLSGELTGVSPRQLRLMLIASKREVEGVVTSAIN